MRNSRLLRSLGLAFLVASPLACSAGAHDDARSTSDESALGTVWWSQLGYLHVSQVVAATNTDGKPSAFLLYGGNVAQYLPPSVAGGAWSGSSTFSVGGPAPMKQIAVGHNADGRLEVFGLGTDGVLYHRWQQGFANAWGGWQSLGGLALQQVVVDNEADGRLAAFVLGGDGLVYVTEQGGPNAGWGGFWANVGGGPFKTIATGHDGNGALEVLGIDTSSNALWDCAEGGANGAFGSWASLGGWNLQQLVVGQNQDGRIEAFVRGGDGVLYHQWRVPGSGAWSGWSTIGGSQLQDIAVASEANGAMDAFAVGGDHAPYETQQGGPNGGWGGIWFSLNDGTSLSKISAMRTPDGLLHLFAVASDGTVRTTYEQSPNGAWAPPPPPPPPPGPCSYGQPGTLTIDAFNTLSGDQTVNLGDWLDFRVTAQSWASTGGAVFGTLDGKPATSITLAGGGVATTATIGPAYSTFVTAAMDGTTHTLSLPSQSCGNTTASLTIHVATPTPPVPTLKASSTYVYVNAPVKLTVSVPSFRPRDCQATAYDLVGTDYAGNVVYHRENLPTLTPTVYPSDETYYHAVTRCTNVPSAGYATSSKVDVSVYSPPPASNPWWCFTITTPTTPSQPGSCWAEAIQAPDETTATNLENGRNGGSGVTVDSLGQCTSIPTNACPWPFAE
jgi:hypothetical protein